MGFDDFDQWVLISGFGILMGGLMMLVVGLMMDAGLMIAIALIVDGGWVLS